MKVGGDWEFARLFVQIMGYGGADGTRLGFGGSGCSGVQNLTNPVV